MNMIIYSKMKRYKLCIHVPQPSQKPVYWDKGPSYSRASRRKRAVVRRHLIGSTTDRLYIDYRNTLKSLCTKAK